MAKSKTQRVIEKMREKGWRLNCEIDGRVRQFFLRQGYDNATVIDVSDRVAIKGVAK